MCLPRSSVLVAIWVVCILGSVAQAAVNLQGVLPPSRRGKYRSDRYMVKFRGEDEPRLVYVRNRRGVSQLASLEAELRAAKAQPGVEYAEVDHLMYIAHEPNDPDFKLEARNYHLKVTGAAAAWSNSTGSAAVRVCVIDTGVDFNHPDLSANIMQRNGTVVGATVVDGPSPAGMDDSGHGTHVAGIIGAVGDNSYGGVGVNWKVSILPCKFLNKKGLGSESSAIKCINWCKSQKAAIISGSFGASGGGIGMRTAIANSGALFLAAAGNAATNAKVFPAGFSDLPNVVAVAATGKKDAWASFSSFGPWVSLAAPGFAIRSTYLNSSYKVLSGTSMSTPVVSGAAALALAARGGPQSIPPAILKLMLEQSVDKVPELAGRVATGGRLNVYKLLNMAIPTPPSPSPSPLPSNNTTPAIPPSACINLAGMPGICWLNVMNSDCQATCAAAGKTPLSTGTGSALMHLCAYTASSSSGIYWPGTKTSNPSSCQGVYSQASSYVVYSRSDSDYVCGCVDGTPVWTTGSCEGSTPTLQPICTRSFSPNYLGWSGSYGGQQHCFYSYNGGAYRSTMYKSLCTAATKHPKAEGGFSGRLGSLPAGVEVLGDVTLELI